MQNMWWLGHLLMLVWKDCTRDFVVKRGGKTPQRRPWGLENIRWLHVSISLSAVEVKITVFCPSMHINPCSDPRTGPVIHLEGDGIGSPTNRTLQRGGRTSLDLNLEPSRDAYGEHWWRQKLIFVLRQEGGNKAKTDARVLYGWASPI